MHYVDQKKKLRFFDWENVKRGRKSDKPVEIYDEIVAILKGYPKQKNLHTLKNELYKKFPLLNIH